ncbi:MAG: GAF domain-containing protein, partial [Elusimicrobia bacterium]|nr:GAF domain-containing protein [Elusimicrobiota bacterium]
MSLVQMALSVVASLLSSGLTGWVAWRTKKSRADRIFLPFGILLTLVAASSWAWPKGVGWSLAAMAVSLAVTLVTLRLLPVLVRHRDLTLIVRKVVGWFVGRWLFRTQYDREEALRRFSQEIVTILDQAALLKAILQVPLEVLAVKRTVLFLRGPDGAYESKAWMGAPPGLQRLPADHPLVRSLAHVGRGIERGRRGAPGLKEELDQTFTALNAEVCFPLIAKEVLWGILVLGPKASASGYSHEDLTLLQFVANNAAVALENAALFEQSRLEKEKWETIAQHMSDGILLTDEAFHVVAVNQRAVQLLDLPSPVPTT